MFSPEQESSFQEHFHEPSNSYVNGHKFFMKDQSTESCSGRFNGAVLAIQLPNSM